MIFSFSKKSDIEQRIQTLNVMTLCLRMFEKTKDDHWIARAKYYGDLSKKIKERISSGDYSCADKSFIRCGEKIFVSKGKV